MTLYISCMVGLLNRLKTVRDENTIVNKTIRNLSPSFVSQLALKEITTKGELSDLYRQFEESGCERIGIDFLH